jgi:hypothetical protein
MWSSEVTRAISDWMGLNSIRATVSIMAVSVFLERRNQGGYRQSGERGGLFHFLGCTKFRLDACWGRNKVVLCHFFDGDRAVACLVLEFCRFLRVV